MIRSSAFASGLGCLLFTFASPVLAQFAPPDPAELAMTAIPEVPGAPAVVLYREQTADDQLHMWSFYSRVKVLTEGGKEQANVELPYVINSLGVSIDSIVGRTIHADGTIVPFTGKPYDKLIEKSKDFSLRSKVFTLPQVEVGSVIEYRYKFRFDDGYFLPPDWYIQSKLYLRKAHYEWKPTGYATSGDLLEPTHVAWTPFLPKSATIQQRVLSNSSSASSGTPNMLLSLDVHDIAPLPEEEATPPLESLSYRVLFYYTSAKTEADFWKTQGKVWSKARDKFMGPNAAVRAAATTLTAPADTPEVKLKKLYDAVMQLENTDFTRAHTTQEEKAAGLKDINSTDDVLKRRRGSSNQLAELFVALARASGMKAYVMGVTDRDEHFFISSYLQINQMDDYIAIVNVDGKDQFFDPGQRFCTFKHLAWKHSQTGGLRQTDDGVQLVSTPGEPFTASRTTQVADLALDEHGEADGTVTLTFTGDPALRWRHQALRGDDTSLNADLRQHLEQKLPGGMEVRVTDVANLTDPDKPLTVKYAVKGAIGSPTGKRLLVPASLFASHARPEFPAAKRELAIDMHYSETEQDAVRLKLPASLTIESVPAADSVLVKNIGAFSVNSKQAGNAITLYRNLTVAKVYYMPDEYAELKGFYGKLDSKQSEPLILTHADPGAAKAVPSSN